MPAKRIFEIAFKGDAKQAEAAFGSVGKQVEGLTGKLQTLGGGGALAGTAVVAGAVAGGAALFKLGGDFDEVYDGIQTTTGKTGKDLDKLKDNFRAVVKDVPTDFKSAGLAIGDLSAKTGLTGKPLEDMTKNVLNLSRITKTDLKTNVEAAAKATKDWNLPATEAAGALDKMFKASQNTGVNFAALSSQMDKVGPTARGMGLSFDETTGLLSQLDKAGVDSAAVFKGLTKDLVGQAAETAKAHVDETKAMEKLDAARQLAATGAKGAAEKVAAAQIDVSNAHLRVQAAEELAAQGAAGMRQKLEETSAAIKSAATDQEALSIATAAFGKKAGPELADALRSGKVSLDDLTSTIAGAGGAIGKTASDTADAHEKMQVAFQNIKLALEPLATGVFNFVGVLAEKLAPIIVEISNFIGDHFIGIIEGLGLVLFPIPTALFMLYEKFGFVRDIVKVVADFFVDDLIPAAQKVWDKIQAFGDWLSDVFSGKWSKVWDGVKDTFEAIWNGFVTFVTKWLPENFLPALADIGTKALGWIGEMAPKLLAKLGDWTLQFIAWVVDVTPKLVTKLADVSVAFLKWIGDVAPGVLAKLGDWTLQFLGWVADVIPKLALEYVKLEVAIFKWLGETALKIPGELLHWAEKFVSFATGIAGSMAPGMAAVITWIGNQAANIPGQLVHWTTQFVAWVGSLGASAAGAIANFVTDIGESIINYIKARLPTFLGGVSGLQSHATNNPNYGPNGEPLTIVPGPSGGTGGGDGYTAPEAAMLAKAHGFSGQAARIMGAIIMAESGGNPKAIGDVALEDGTWGPSVGLSQVRSMWAQDHTGGWRDQYALKNPGFNLDAAYSISSHGTNFGPWSTYKSGAYSKYLNQIPAMAMGGIVKARPGGTLILAAEAGEDEAIVPLGRGGTATAMRPVAQVIVQGDVYGERDFLMKIRNGFIDLKRQGIDLGFD